MRFRFFSIGLLFSLAAITLYPVLGHAQLDWHSDVVVFGTEQHEWHPHIVEIRPGEHRSFCAVDSNVLRMRRSLLHGEIWEAFSDAERPPGEIELSVAADEMFSYVISYSVGGSYVAFCRIPHDASDWPEQSHPVELTEDLTLLDAKILSDKEFSPDDPYVHIFVLVEDFNHVGRVGHVYASDRGLNWHGTNWFAEGLALPDSIESLAAAVSWSGESERLWAAVAEDRAGSVGE
ncbi:MAG: hypothetical protein H6505_06550, partial [Calditrichaeota bacterium]|nr:hypothetical protein [Calditrichota bacterium]